MQQLPTIKNHMPTECEKPCSSLVNAWKLQGLENRIAKTWPLVFKAGKGLSESERKNIENTISTARSLLSLPANSDQIANAVASICGNLVAQRGDNIEVKAAGYAMALEGAPMAVVAKVAKSAIIGETGGILSDKFLPTAAELRDYCKTIIGSTENSIRYLERLLSATEDQPRETITDERRQQLERQIMDASEDKAA